MRKHAPLLTLLGWLLGLALAFIVAGTVGALLDADLPPSEPCTTPLPLLLCLLPGLALLCMPALFVILLATVVASDVILRR